MPCPLRSCSVCSREPHISLCSHGHNLPGTHECLRPGTNLAHTRFPLIEVTSHTHLCSPAVQYLEEDPRTNRIDDSLQLFTAICQNKLLAKAALVLMLNKACLRFAAPVVSYTHSRCAPPAGRPSQEKARTKSLALLSYCGFRARDTNSQLNNIHAEERRTTA